MSPFFFVFNYYSEQIPLCRLPVLGQYDVVLPRRALPNPFPPNRVILARLFPVSSEANILSILPVDPLLAKRGASLSPLSPPALRSTTC